MEGESKALHNPQRLLTSSESYTRDAKAIEKADARRPKAGGSKNGRNCLLDGWKEEEEGSEDHPHSSGITLLHLANRRLVFSSRKETGLRGFSQIPRRHMQKQIQTHEEDEQHSPRSMQFFRHRFKTFTLVLLSEKPHLGSTSEEVGSSWDKDGRRRLPLLPTIERRERVQDPTGKGHTS